jgi:hypothetical protein
VGRPSAVRARLSESAMPVRESTRVPSRSRMRGVFRRRWEADEDGCLEGF